MRDATVPELLSRAKVPELLNRAKQAIESGEFSLQNAAEDIASAQVLGATQRQIAEAVGKSAAWVNRLLKWRQSGYQDGTAFGPQARASRERARRVHSTEQKNEIPATTSEQAQAAEARARAETAKAEVAKARADAQKAKADAARAKADAAKAKADAKARFERAFRFSHDPFAGNRFAKEVDVRARELLVKVLGMLGSDQAGERAAAASVVEQQRSKIGMTWDELIVRAYEATARAA